jgi:NADPH-dependent dioxygenase
MVAPLPGGAFRLLLSDRGEAADPTLTPQQAFMRLLERHFDGITMGDVVWHSKWETWVRLADTFRQGNVFLAGDAAHVHSTTGGQGMNCCMQDAFNLGWKLALVLMGHATPDLLDSYEAERRPIAEPVIWAASSLHDIFMTHGKDIAQRKQTMFDPAYTERVVNTCSGVAYTYRDYIPKPAALTDLDGPAIGDRAPDIDFEQGGSLFDRIRHPYFTLLVMPGNRAAMPVVEQLQRRFSSLLAVETLPASEALSKRYGAGDGRLYLIRPDGYIGFKCAANEAPQL